MSIRSERTPVAAEYRIVFPSGETLIGASLGRSRKRAMDRLFRVKNS